MVIWHHTAVPYYGTDICNGSRKSGPSAKHKMCADQMCGSSLNVKVNPFVFLVDTGNKLLENETLKWKSKFFQLANLRPKNQIFGSEKLQIGFKDYCCGCCVGCCWGTRLLITFDSMEEEMSVWRASPASWWLTDAHGAQRNPILTEQQQLTNNNSNNNNNKQQPWMLPINKNKQEYQNGQ